MSATPNPDRSSALFLSPDAWRAVRAAVEDSNRRARFELGPTERTDTGLRFSVTMTHPGIDEDALRAQLDALGPGHVVRLETRE